MVVKSSVTNTGGYISGGTHSATTETVGVAELVSGTKSITANGTGIDVSTYEKVDVNVSGTSKNVQILQSTTRATSSSYTKICGDITVAKTGTYDVYWSGFRSTTSGTSGSQLYIGNTAYGSAHTSFTNHVQNVHLSNVSLTANQKISVYGRSRGSNYYMYVGELIIIES